VGGPLLDGLFELDLATSAALFLPRDEGFSVSCFPRLLEDTVLLGRFEE
jgi:hypothetical protein